VAFHAILGEVSVSAMELERLHATAMPPFSVMTSALKSRRYSLPCLACAPAISQSQQLERVKRAASEKLLLYESNTHKKSIGENRGRI
jgi:hypothetical protein